jgi:hypothetical protein
LSGLLALEGDVYRFTKDSAFFSLIWRVLDGKLDATCFLRFVAVDGGV